MRNILSGFSSLSTSWYCCTDSLPYVSACDALFFPESASALNSCFSKVLGDFSEGIRTYFVEIIRESAGRLLKTFGQMQDYYFSGSISREAGGQARVCGQGKVAGDCLRSCLQGKGARSHVLIYE